METVIYIPFKNAALDYAGRFLVSNGITATSMAGSDVTHLLLPVPAFHYEEDLDRLLRQLPDAVCIIGGSLNHSNPEKYPMIDLLQDPFYLAENAAITAHCAVKYIWNALPVTLEGQPVLIIGWGRIGKCLARLLRGMGASVTILARKETDRAMARALGYACFCPEADLSRFRVIVNTAPAVLFSEAQMKQCRQDCCKLDLASVKGLPGQDVVWARGLPGKDAPESSGKLIADAIIRIFNSKEVL